MVGLPYLYATIKPREDINLMQTIYQPSKIDDDPADFLAAEVTGLALTPKFRALLILHTAWQTQSEHVWNAHQAIARSAGISDAQMAAIQQNQIQAFVFTAMEQKLLEVLSHITTSHKLSPEKCREARQYFSDRELVEIVGLQGYYCTISQ